MVQQQKKKKQNKAKGLRVCAIVLAGFSGLLLICSQQWPTVSSGWATAVVIVAGTLVAIDRFFGLTTGWIRYIETANRIRLLLHEFKLDWAMAMCELNRPDGSTRNYCSVIALATEFVAAVDQAVSKEIDDWAAEFRTSVSRHNNQLDSTQHATLASPTQRAGTMRHSGNGPAPQVTPAPQLAVPANPPEPVTPPQAASPGTHESPAQGDGSTDSSPGGTQDSQTSSGS